VQRFMRITLPLLKPTIVTTVLLTSLMSLANFTIIYLMTGGGPGNDTMILPVYSYQQGFFFNDLAYGALIGNITVLIATIFSALFVYFSRPRP
jgi:multiple sugar transport system permease protein